MSETDGTTETTEVVTPDSTTTETTETESFINADLTLKEGWENVLVPEAQRGKGVYKMVKSVQDAFNMLGNQATMIGKQGKVYAAPDKDAKPEEQAAFYRSLGVPDKPGDYKFEVPKGMEAHYQTPEVKAVLERFHKARLTPEQVQTVIAADAELQGRFAEQLSKQSEAERLAGENELKQRWGAAYTERLHIANRVIAENVSEKDREAVLAAIGNNPWVADFLANIGKRFMEAKVMVDDQSGAQTTAEMTNQINEKMLTPAYMDGNHPNHKRAVAEVQKMFEQRNASKRS